MRDFNLRFGCVCGCVWKPKGEEIWREKLNQIRWQGTRAMQYITFSQRGIREKRISPDVAGEDQPRWSALPPRAFSLQQSSTFPSLVAAALPPPSFCATFALFVGTRVCGPSTRAIAIAFLSTRAVYVLSCSYTSGAFHFSFACVYARDSPTTPRKNCKSIRSMNRPMIINK